MFGIVLFGSVVDSVWISECSILPMIRLFLLLMTISFAVTFTVVEQFIIYSVGGNESLVHFT